MLFVILSVAALLWTPLRDFIEPARLHDRLEWIAEHPAAPVFFLLGFLCLSLLGSPMIPMAVAGAAVFGFGRGFALNYVGVLLGASSSYWLARALGRDFARRLLGSRYGALEAIVKRRGFWPMVQMRFLPIPFPVANYAPALVGVGYPLFLASTALAYVPILLVYSHFAAVIVRAGDAESEAILHKLGLSVLLLFLLTFLPPLIGRWRAGRRRAPPGEGEGAGLA